MHAADDDALDPNSKATVEAFHDQGGHEARSRQCRACTEEGIHKAAWAAGTAMEHCKEPKAAQEQSQSGWYLCSGLRGCQ